MKLLFDENLSPRLVELVRNEYPDSMHVRNVGLRGASDSRIWAYARDHGFAIVSKDDDFRQRSLFEGAPPKVIWLQVGNAGTGPIAELLRGHVARLRSFDTEDQAAFLVVALVDPADPSV